MASVESGTDLTLLITVIGTGAVVVGALFGFGVFFLRRMDAANRDMQAEMRTEFQNVRNEIQGVRNEIQNVRTEIQGVRTDLGPRIDRVNSRVDQVILAVSKPASEQTAAADL